MTKRIFRYSGLGLALLTAGAIAACSSSDGGTPAAAGSGAGGAHAGGAAGASAGAPAAGAGVAGSAAGAAPTAGNGGAGAGYACAGTVPTSAVITDFSNLTPNADNPGNYKFIGGVLGGTYTYQPMALTLDTLGGTALNIKGNVKDYDGFGLYFETCYNAGAYTGVSFKIKGNAGAKGTLNFRVQTNVNTAIGSAASPKGTCVTATPLAPYPDCHAPGVDIAVTSTDTVITVPFSTLSGGLPSDTVDNMQIVGLEWAFNWDPNAGAAGAGAGGASGGTGGASAGSGGASAGSGGASAGAAGKGGSGGASAGSGGASGGAGGASAGSGGASAGSSGSGTVAGSYNADITIDDVRFIGGPPAGGAGGASSAGASAGGASSAGTSSGGAGAGGASAGSGGAKAGSGGTAG